MEHGPTLCLVDSATTHTIFTDRRFFRTLNKSSSNISTITNDEVQIVGSGRASIILPKGTELLIENALLYPQSKRTLLSFRDIRSNGFHIETKTKNNDEFLIMTQLISGKKREVEELASLSSGLYYTYIQPNNSCVALTMKLKNPHSFQLWHDRLGHPGQNMMGRIISNSAGHSLLRSHVLSPNMFTCVACAKGKYIVRPSRTKVGHESPIFLQRLQGDICGPISPPSGPFRYFMVLFDASTRWTHVSLLSTRNKAFAKFIAKIIELNAQFPDYPIKSIRMDNAGEFTSTAFNDYCMALGIKVEHPVPYVHTQNGLAESLIKRIKMIARPLLQKSGLPVSCWGHAVLHAAALIQIRPTAYHDYSPLQLLRGVEPNIFHLRVFGCAVYTPIPPTNRTSMGPQRKLGIYVGYESPSIIKYLEPMTGDQFTARYADCIFDEDHFPALGGDKSPYLTKCREISWDEKDLQYLDPRTSQTELEVQKIINLQNLANNLPDAFTDNRGVTRSHIPAVNAPSRVEVPKGSGMHTDTPHRQKRGRPVGAKDLNPRKTRIGKISQSLPKNFSRPEDGEPSESARALNKLNTGNAEHPDQNILGNDNDLVDINIETAINFVDTGETYNRDLIVVDDTFAYAVAHNIPHNNLDPEPKSITECQKRPDWLKWKEAIEAELNSLNKRKVFGPTVLTPKDVIPVGSKWVFVRKRNENNEVVRYKARLVAQGFTQRPGIDFEQTYSPVIDGISFRYLISLAVNMKLDMQLMDVVTAYLYGSLDADIYMKIPEGIQNPNTRGKDRNMYSIKLQRSLYGLKQSGRMWYNHLSEFLLKKGYVKNDICPCIFIKKSSNGFCIISVYVDDMNIIGTNKDIIEACSYLKAEFEMKDLGKTKFCLGLQIEHLPNGIFIHQANYVNKLLEKFYMDKSHPLSTPMVVRSLEADKDPFRPKEDNEDILGPEVPYLSAIGALLYLANCTRPDIAFSVNLLARFSASPTRRHWSGVKHIFRYLQGTKDLGLYFENNQDITLMGYSDAGYMSDPHNAKSQTGYVFLCGGTAISWRSVKQTLVATSSNHSEIIALYEASRECVWLRSLIQHIHSSCGTMSKVDSPTVLYEDNAACVAQMSSGYVKGGLTKHIAPKFFYPHELQKSGEILIEKVRSSENLADLFTKSLPTSTFEKFVYKIGMRRLGRLLSSGGAINAKSINE
uniref:Putative copia-like polyprotein n=1 Tax=Ipomoea trifida TaxID=35884 RepID=Q6JJ56_IPOTF|nr:putative copia-like polyprotein [Ipomoea trifida]